MRALHRAFTLLELLLAIAISAVVMTAIMFVFYSALKLRNRTHDVVERSLPLQQTLAIIKRDLSNLVPPTGKLAGALQSTPTYSTIGSSLGTSSSRNRGSGPDFYTAAGVVDDTGPWGEVQRVSYFLAAPTNNVPGQDLYRSVARNLLPLNQYTTDDQYLMSGVEQITFQYYDGNSWKDTWDSTTTDQTTGLTNNLPLAIKLQLRLHSAGRSAATLAPVELVVPVPVQARTNAPVEIAGVTP
jgi:type II secretion system protein J